MDATQGAAAPLRECDVVMKGGITSGVIYPRLLATLSSVYKLRSFGGTSAGAIAAAAGAAAQLGVSSGANPDAFSILDKLPSELGTTPRAGAGSMLLMLFQPQRTLAPLFALLKAALNASSAGERLRTIGIQALLQFPLGAILGMLPGLVTYWYARGAGALLSILFAIIGALVGAATSAILCLGRELPANGFGLCSGMPAIGGERAAQEPLTPWLHRYLNRLAGKPPGEPLTFGELWAGRLRVEGQVPDRPADGTARVIDLAMITTALNLGRPYRLPFETDDFYFLKEDMERLFPASVVSWLVEHARPSATATALSSGNKTYYALPVAAEVPVIMAVRLSLSFPILLAAVPFHIVDRTLAVNEKGPTRATAVFFSDGGLCSNFPIQFFDSALPTRPTFGVDLQSFHPDHRAQRVWMPAPMENREGIQSYCPPLPTARTLRSVAGFVDTLVSTMQNWQDQMQLVMPGFRDRIVHVCHTAEEGGLNLDMPPPTIATLAGSGAEAATQLIKAFAEGGGLAAPNAWDNHQRSRVRTLLCLVQQQLESISAALARERDPTWEQILVNAHPPSYPFHAEQLASAAGSLLMALDSLAHAFPSAGASLCAGAPRPSPELKVAPRV
jgi:predicted acylesterase/phospholipase RssA